MKESAGRVSPFQGSLCLWHAAKIALYCGLEAVICDELRLNIFTSGTSSVSCSGYNFSSPTQE
jgi:hypothetical protein